MIVLFLLAIALLWAAGNYLVRHELKRRASLMTDDELREAMPRADGVAVIIYCDELERREVSATMMARVL